MSLLSQEASEALNLLAGVPPRLSLGRRRQRLTLAAVGLTVGAALLGLLRNHRASRPEQFAGLLQVEGKAEHHKRECDEYPYLKIERSTHNNLAGKGTDTGREGISYRTLDLGRGAGPEQNREVDMRINAVGGYVPFSPRLNGMQGKYGSINLKSGSKVSLKFTFWDHKTQEQLRMPHFAFTFFDLDQGLNGASRESVTINKYQSYHLTKTTEVQVTHNQDNSTTFMSSKFGTGEDNPKDPMFLNQQQQNRAVTLMFRDRKEIDVTFAASAGIEPRFFTFVGRPSLLCAITVGKNFKPPLPDLRYKTPMQVPIVAHKHDSFEQWFVRAGDEVEEGSNLCSTKKRDGSTYIYKAPYRGTVNTTQGELLQGDKIDLRLDDKALVVIDRVRLSPLKCGSSETPTTAPEGVFLNKFHVKKGDVVKKGDAIAEVDDGNGGHKATVQARKDGTVIAVQDDIKPGDPVEKAEDRNIATIGKMAALPVHPGNTPTTAPSGSKFKKYMVKVGDTVKTGDPIAEVTNTAGVAQTLSTPTGGVVTAIQDDLKEGMNLDDALPDSNLAIVGKFPPLKVEAGQTATNIPAGMSFEKWHVKTNDIIDEGDPIADLKNSEGVRQTVTAPKAGVIKERQDRLKKGMKIDDAMADRNLATVGKLPPLQVGPGEGPAEAPDDGTWSFVAWRVNVGDTVAKGDPVATVKQTDGKSQDITASKFGVVKARQEHLREGNDLKNVMVDNNVLVIGKFPAMHPYGPWEKAVDAPMNSYFNKYYVQESQSVQAGDKILQVTLPSRRLQSGAATGAEGTKVDIKAPCWGKVSSLQPLKPNQQISEAQMGPTVAVLNQGTPWWVYFLGVLSMLCCCLCLLFGVMKKPEPPRKVVPTAPVAPPPPEPVKKPNGLELEFEDGDEVRIVYAEWRPLGIKHMNELPIIADDFTVNSYAKQKLEVKRGWKLRRIGDKVVHDTNDTFDEVNEKLTHYMKDFKLWPLPIVFWDPQADERKTVNFTERPIGLVFTNKVPIKVRKVHPESPADKAEIKVGFHVIKIGEADVSKDVTFRQTILYFTEGVKALDDSGRTYNEDNES